MFANPIRIRHVLYCLKIVFQDFYPSLFLTWLFLKELDAFHLF